MDKWFGFWGVPIPPSASLLMRTRYFLVGGFKLLVLLVFHPLIVLIMS